PKLLGVGAFSAAWAWAHHRIDRSRPVGTIRARMDRLLEGLPRAARGALVVLLAVAAVGGARGSFGGRPALRKWSAVTGDRLLDDAVLNPPIALFYVLKDHLRLRRTSTLEAHLPDRD